MGIILGDSLIFLDKPHNGLVLTHPNLAIFLIKIVPDIVENLKDVPFELWVNISFLGN
jgi:hypothetical protein